MSYFINHSKTNEKHVKSSDSDQHVTQQLLTQNEININLSLFEIITSIISSIK